MGARKLSIQSKPIQPARSLDEKLFFFINRHWTAPALDWVMAVASSFDFWIPLILLAAVLVLWRGSARGRLAVACVALAILVSASLDGPLKRTFNRLRPYQVIAGTRQVDLDHRARPRLLALGRALDVHYSPASPPVAAEGRSFPSGHTMNNFAAATMLALCFRRRRGWLYFPVAALVGWSRIYVGSHWPSDVLLSALLGCGLALVTAAGIAWAWRRWVGEDKPGPFVVTIARSRQDGG